MVAALAAARGRPVVARCTRFGLAGTAKYAACTALGSVAACLLWHVSRAAAAPGFVLAFYALEARLVFLFPTLIDDGTRWSHAARRLVARAGGVPRAMTVVIPLAAVMLTGGFAGRGFVRSWLLGCAAVLLWYEDLRRRPRATRRPRLDVGGRAPLAVRRESVEVHGGPTTRRILFVSDLHLGALGTRHLPRELASLAARERPDLILVGGDLVDRGRGLAPLRGLFAEWSATAPTLAVPGNHDRFAGLARVRAAVRRAGAHWLPDAPYAIDGLTIDPVPRPRTDDSCRILCAHHPRVFARAVAADYDLVFAGHLHGGQVVLFERAGLLYPGAWLDRWNGTRFRRARTHMLVSRGAADTLPVRWRCPREVIVCALESRYGSSRSSSGSVTRLVASLHTLRSLGPPWKTRFRLVANPLQESDPQTPLFRFGLCPLPPSG